MYGYSYFPNPATAGADRLGEYLISALVIFGLVFLFNAYRMKKIRQGGFRTSRPKSPRQKARPGDVRCFRGTAAHHESWDLPGVNMKL